MSEDGTKGRRQDELAHLRFSVIGHLLAAPPKRGELFAAIEELAKTTWRHPVTGEQKAFGFSTIERWYYAARKERSDPVGVLRRRIRKDAGRQTKLSAALKAALLRQYREHKGWSIQLHFDNLGALSEEDKALGLVPSYATVRRYMKAHGLVRVKRRTSKVTPGALAAEARLESLEVRSFEAEYVGGLWHSDFHHGSRRILTPSGSWETPILDGVLDDRSRLCCHAQWYLEETAEVFVHGLSQGIQKRGIPRSLMTDRGTAMKAKEVQAGLSRLGISHDPTLPYSPYQNAKMEVFWASVEGRLMAMLELVKDLTLDLLNEATQAWIEIEYNREVHGETGMPPLRRYLDGPDVLRPSPSSEDLRRAFRTEAFRHQRKSDGTLTIEGVRFEVPSRFRHLDRLLVRYAGWDLRSADLADDRTGQIIAVLRPLDRTKNADGLRRSLEPLATIPEAMEEPGLGSGIAPLLRKLMAEYAATGLPPAYLPHRKPEAGMTGENGGPTS